ncbi:hypothetical protein [Mycolicibacterium arenosum]|uniref:Secreted peptide n=1 Tax=Mycolicibacterium arenosum TaxID=2952157 RepID=A0ABT1M4B4_9MYCO|nr:hypothetical protein [Mycolicibacterium sp. CAU 1645]MCP9273994.1 hypothetical protein [Mycolicibacterium sp. CAU 1645]
MVVGVVVVVVVVVVAVVVVRDVVVVVGVLDVVDDDDDSAAGWPPLEHPTAVAATAITVSAIRVNPTCALPVPVDPKPVVGIRRWEGIRSQARRIAFAASVDFYVTQAPVGTFAVLPSLIIWTFNWLDVRA